MPRLPHPGSDQGQWGTILNDYLSQAHNPDGSLKDNSVTTNAIAPNTITTPSIHSDAITEAKLDPTVRSKLNSGGGTQGPTGPQGATGAQGAPGTPGTAGTPGSQGPTGPQGPQGPQGPASTIPGPAGATGPAGQPGADSTVPGPQGSQGPTGPQGATGASGMPGSQGSTGPQGSQGTPGATGPQGTAGPSGPAGANGSVGATGASGQQGATGAQGTMGATGPAGATTIGGIDGLQGELEGKRGRINAVIDVNGADAYMENFRITNDGSATSTWPERLTFFYRDTMGGTYYRTGYFNEYGEIRVAPGKPNTVAFRAFTREYTTQPARNMSVPIIELMDDRTNRNQLFAVMPNGQVIAPNIGNKVTTSNTAPSSPSVGDVWVDTSS